VVKNNRRFRHHLCPHHQGLIPETSVTFDHWTQLRAEEDFYQFSPLGKLQILRLSSSSLICHPRIQHYIVRSTESIVK
jgi:hypothetical protein